MLALVLPAAAHAWGDEGHEVIGLIADHYLTPAAREKMNALLGTDTSGLTSDSGIAAEATWADHFRDSDRDTGKTHYYQTRAWHFVDIEIAQPDIDAACFNHPRLRPSDPASEGPADDCIVDKIEEFSRELAEPKTAPGERLLALQFLLHFVGDVHQPLHAGDDHDRGGNEKMAGYAHARGGNLHHFWDTVFVEGLGRNSAQIAQALIAGISTEQRRLWSSGTPSDWAFQSFQLARSLAYGKLPTPGPGGRYSLDDAYVADATEAVRGQLERAGVRLAQVLNTDLR